MKRIPQKQVCLTIEVEKNGHPLYLSESIHTTIHSLKIKIAKSRQISHLQCQIDIYGPGSRNPLKPSTTLLQNGITSNAYLKCIINRISLMDNVDEDNDKIQYFGLHLLASCTNKYCLSHDKDVLVGVGYGSFALFDLISELRCDLCPYKSEHFRPLMKCKAVKVKKGRYSIKTIVKDINGIPQEKVTEPIKTKSEEDLTLLREINGHVIIQVKHI